MHNYLKNHWHVDKDATKIKVLLRASLLSDSSQSEFNKFILIVGNNVATEAYLTLLTYLLKPEQFPRI